MRRIVLSLVIGVTAGVIDIIPMVAQGLDAYSNVSALVHWIVLGFVISHISLGIPPWLKGLVVSVLLAIPTAILVAAHDPKSVLPIMIMSTVLGGLVGYATDRYAK
jgi:hypothetical protein